jgi:hypothetical protein
MPPPAPQARKQDAGGDGAAASVSIAQSIAPATARHLAAGQGQTTAGSRPRFCGRWLTGFKDLWLTGALSRPGRPPLAVIPDQLCVREIRTPSQPGSPVPGRPRDKAASALAQ